MRSFRAAFSVSLSAAIFIYAASPALAQTAPDEHQQHHPQQQMSPMPSPQANTNSNANSNANASGGMSNGAASNGISGGMGDMMKRMGTPPQKELFPSLINLPSDLSAEKREEIRKLADERVSEGSALISSGTDKLKNASQNQDFDAVREANAQIRQGQTLLESGLAAQKALAENQNPQDVSFRWFKQNMNLARAVEVGRPHGFFGLSWFHYISMLTLAAFSAAMIWMYFRKMRRANDLLVRLTGGATSNPAVPALPTNTSLSQNSSVQPANVSIDIAPSKSNSWSGTLLVSKIFEETPQVKTFRLTDPTGGKNPFNYLPGQFVTVTVVPNGLPLKRSYTIASSPTKRDYLEITVKHEQHGTVSHYLNTQIHEGELLQLTGPSGRFTFTGEEAASIVLIAGGVGVTPLMSVIRYLTDRSWKGDIFFLFGSWSEEQIIFREEIEYLSKRYPNLHVTIMLEHPGSASKDDYLSGLITKEILAERVPEIASRRVHVCGPPPMIDAVKQMLDELRVPEESVHTEIFVGKLPAPKSAPPKDTGKTAVATFARSRKAAVLTPDKTILEASEDVGVNIDYSCRVGTCGICKTRLLSGKVTMDVEEALTDEDKEQNIILACQAKATEDVAVDA
jgi:glycine betaine catabolism B